MPLGNWFHRHPESSFAECLENKYKSLNLGENQQYVDAQCHNNDPICV